MENDSSVKKINPKILIIVFAFVPLFLAIVLVSFLKPSQKIKKGEEKLTPTPVALNIPEGVEIPTPKIESPGTVLVNRYGEVSFAALEVSFPASANVYTTVPGPIDLASARTIASRLGFSEPGKQTDTRNGLVESYVSDTKTLVFYLESGNIQYFSGEIKDKKTASSKEEVINKAFEFIRFFAPLSDGLIPDQDSLVYYLGTGELERTESFDRADIYDVPFVQKINNLPVYSQFGSNARAHVWVNKSLNITRLTLNTNNRLTATRAVPLLAFSGAKERIINGKGTIARYGTEDNSILPPPQKTLFTKAQVAYLRDNSQNILYPIFVFEGIAQTTSGNQKITVYLPATND